MSSAVAGELASLIMDAAPPPPKKDDADITVYFKVALAVLYYIAYPIFTLVRILYLILVQVLRPAWSVISFITLPVVYLVAFLGHLLSLPFTLAAKLETVYIFLGIAVLIGLSTGLFLTVLSSFTNSALQLDGKAPPERLRTLSSFRATRGKRKSSDSPLPPPLVAQPSKTEFPVSPLSPLSPGPARPAGFLSSTIMEEDDSE